jgi:predicted ATP-dependent endonuclease of OLD family
MQTHLKHFGLENFRVFKNRTDFDFAPITILTGTNSSGKSSLISAMEILSSSNLTTQESRINLDALTHIEQMEMESSYLITNRKVETDYHILNFYPKILSDIQQLNLFPFAKTKGNFNNLLSRNSTENVISFSIEEKFKEFTEPFFGRISYSKHETEAGFSFGLLSELILTANSEDDQNLKVFQLKKIPSGYQVIINWRFFLLLHHRKAKEQADLSLRSEIRRQDLKKRFDENKESLSFLEIFEMNSERVSNYRKPKDNDGFKKDTNNTYTVFNPNKKFLCIEQKRNSKAIMELKDDMINPSPWAEKVGSFSKRFNLNPILPIYSDANTMEQFIGVVKDVVIPPIETYFNSTDEITYFVNDSNFVSINTLLSEIIFDDDYNSSLIEENNPMHFYLYKLGLGLSFSDCENGKLAKVFFQDFILKGVNNFLVRAFLKFQGLNYLKTNRSLLSRQVEILEVNKAKNQTAHLVNMLIQSVPDIQKTVIADLNKYFSDSYLGIADEVKIQINENSNDSAVILLRKRDDWFNLSDEGFGVNAVFSVVLLSTLANDNNNTLIKSIPETEQKLGGGIVLVIEEPESNLHPALQSKLADVFVDVAKRFNTQFIIETHSEYLIRKLQYLTAKKEIKPEDTVIYYFYPPDNVPPDEEQVKKININDDGSLTGEFGSGFFDEADNIALELFLLKKSQAN